MADGRIKISIEVDGKEVNIASKELNRLEEAGTKSGKGIKAAEDSMDNLSDSSAKAGSNVKGAKDAVDDLGASGSKTGKDLKGTEGSVDGLSDSSARAGSSVKDAGVAIESLGDSGAGASKDLKGTDSAIDSLSDSSANASSGVKGVSDSLGDMSGSANDAAKGAKNVKDETEGMGENTQGASTSLKSLAVSLGLVAIASAAFDTLKSSMDGAISRFDTLNAFPKVLQALGVSAEEADQAMQKLSDGIDGLPTTLDDIAGSAQEMYASFNDMDKATDTALALNNALLGSGSNAEKAKRGTQQYNKALQTGKFDMMTWSTLSETMGVGLTKIGEKFGFAADTAKNDLYKALQDGTITLDQFNDKLIEVGTGTGIMAKLAKQNSLGIATSITNLQNAAARGMADILTSLNKLSDEVTGKEISEHINSLKHVVNASFKAMGSAIENTAPIVKNFSSVVSATIPVVKALSPALIGMFTAYTMHTLIYKTNAALQNSAVVTTLVIRAQDLYTVAIKKNTISQMTDMAVTKLRVASQKTLAAIMTASTAVMNVLTGATSLYTAAKGAATVAVTAFGTALKIMTGPVGIVTVAIGALAGATVALVKWFNKASTEEKKLAEETNKLAESTGSLNDEINGNADAHKNNISEIDASAKKNGELAQKVQELSEKENKSAADKALLNSHIQELNDSIEGLNLTYNEEADALNMSSEQLKARVDLMKEQETLVASQERLVDIMKDRNKVEEKLDEINKNQEKWNELTGESGAKAKEAKEAIKELDEEEAKLNDTKKQLEVQQKKTENQIVTSTEAIAEATKNGVNTQIIDYEKLKDRQKEVFDSMAEQYESLRDAATDAFDKIETKSKISLDKMVENMEHNQKAVQQWGENQAALLQWAGENGYDNFIPYIESIGIDQAGVLAEMVKGVDSTNEGHATALAKLAEIYDEGFGTAVEAGKASLGKGFEEIHGAVVGMVDENTTALRDQIKAADFESIGINVGEGLAKGIEDGSKNAETASKNMSDDTTKAAENAFGIKSPSRVFKGIGSNVADGLALGINQGTSKVVQAIQKMFKSVETNSTNSFKNITKGYDGAVKQIETTLSKLPKVTQKAMQNMTNRLKSGSQAQLTIMKELTKKYDQSVKDIDKSLNKLPKIAQKSMASMLNRLKTGGNSQTNAMRALSKNLVTPFNGMQGRFRTIGVNAMAGLNSGLNAGRGQVMSTARSIANSVASTMQNALRIHSPSRVMKYDVGRWIPEGLAEGIEENASVVYNALNKMSGNMMRFSTPEVVLGVSGMGANASTISQFSSNNTTKTINNNNKPTIHIEKIENYSDTDVPRVLEESAWIMDRERRRLDD